MHKLSCSLFFLVVLAAGFYHSVDAQLVTCRNSPCKNDGVCENQSTSSIYGYKCTCKKGWSGINCDVSDSDSKIIKKEARNYPYHNGNNMNNNNNMNNLNNNMNMNSNAPNVQPVGNNNQVNVNDPNAKIAAGSDSQDKNVKHGYGQYHVQHPYRPSQNFNNYNNQNYPSGSYNPNNPSGVYNNPQYPNQNNYNNPLYPNQNNNNYNNNPLYPNNNNYNNNNYNNPSGTYNNNYNNNNYNNPSGTYNNDIYNQHNRPPYNGNYPNQNYPPGSSGYNPNDPNNRYPSNNYGSSYGNRPGYPNYYGGPNVGCTSGPCMNNGICQPKGGLDYKCICRYGFTGGRCERYYNPRGTLLGIILGTVIPFIVICIIVTIVVYCCCCRKKNRGL